MRESVSIKYIWLDDESRSPVEELVQTMDDIG